MRVLNLAPHPDDEILGAGATLGALIGAGHDVVNLALSLGRTSERARRRRELQQACERLALPLEVLDPPLEMSSGENDDLGAAEERLVEILRDRIARFDLLIAPSPHDGHLAHELVGRAAVGAAAAHEAGPGRVWLWALWSALPRPTTLLAFGEREIARLECALCAHRSQVERNDYARLLRARAEAAAVIGPELLGGFASRGNDLRYAELTCELVRSQGRWLLGATRELEASSPFPPASRVDASAWLASPSPMSLFATGS